MTSEHIINDGDDCLMHISLLLNAIIMHGAMPDSFLYSTMTVLTIVVLHLSSVYLKLIDNVVLQNFLLFFVPASYSLNLKVCILYLN